MFDVAEAAKMQQSYVTEYFLHCRYVHSATSGLISKERGMDIGTSMHCAIFTVIHTAAIVAQAIETKTPQEHVNSATQLMGILIDMESKKEFDKLNKRMAKPTV